MSKLDNASMKFHLACVVKLKEKEKEGYTGWDNPDWEKAFENIVKDRSQLELTQKNLVNISNYCMFLWNLIENKKKGEIKE